MFLESCYFSFLTLFLYYLHLKNNISIKTSPPFAIQNNIEGALIEEYGSDQGTINAAEMLNAMIDQTQQFDRTGGLSELGVTVMDELFKSLAEIAYETLSQGKPLTAAMNQSDH